MGQIDPRRLAAQIDDARANLDQSPKQRAALLTKAFKQLYDAKQPDDQLRERIKKLIAENVERIDCRFKQLKYRHYTAKVEIYLRGKGEIKIEIATEPDTMMIWDLGRMNGEHKPNLDASGFVVLKTEKARLADAAEHARAEKKAGKKLKRGFPYLELAD